MRKVSEEMIYDKLEELEKGSIEDRKLAFDCIGILGNELTPESFENRLKIVYELILNHKKKNKKE